MALFDLVPTEDGWEGQRAAVIDHPHAFLWCMAFSPDGSLLATAGGGEFTFLDRTHRADPAVLFVWDVRAGAFARRDQIAARTWTDLGGDPSFGLLRHRLEAAGKEPIALAFSADGSHVAIGSWAESVRVWDLASGKYVVASAGPTDPAVVLAAPDLVPYYLATGDTDTIVYSTSTVQQIAWLPVIAHVGILFRASPFGNVWACEDGDYLGIYAIESRTSKKMTAVPIN